MKRKIELPSSEAILLKKKNRQKLSAIEEFLWNHDHTHGFQEALQEAYNQGYEDARPKWLPMSDANTTELAHAIDGNIYSPWILVQDAYGNVMQARFWRSKNGMAFNWLDRDGSAVFPEKWMPLPASEIL